MELQGCVERFFRVLCADPAFVVTDHVVRFLGFTAAQVRRNKAELLSKTSSAKGAADKEESSEAVEDEHDLFGVRLRGPCGAINVRRGWLILILHPCCHRILQAMTRTRFSLAIVSLRPPPPGCASCFPVDSFPPCCLTLPIVPRLFRVPGAKPTLPTRRQAQTMTGRMLNWMPCWPVARAKYPWPPLKNRSPSAPRWRPRNRALNFLTTAATMVMMMVMMMLRFLWGQPANLQSLSTPWFFVFVFVVVFVFERKKLAPANQALMYMHTCDCAPGCG